MVSIHLPVIGALVHFNNCSVSLFNDLSMSSSGLVHLSPEEKDEILRSLSQQPELLRSHHAPPAEEDAAAGAPAGG